MNDDKMRTDFEEWFDRSFYKDIEDAWWVWQAAYQAGRKMEREAMRLKNWDGIRLGAANRASDERR